MESTTSSLGDSLNSTDVVDVVPKREIFKHFIKTIMPLIVVFGICGNVLTTWVLHAQLSQKSSFTLYLLVRSVTDNGFLVSMFVVWLDTVDVRWFHVDGICQITLFLSYICGFLSVWSVTFAALENYIRMCRPDKVKLYCKTDKARCIIVVTVSISIVLYTFPLWTANVKTIDGKDHCQPNPKFYYFLVVAVYLDTFFTFLIPLVVVLVSMCAVVLSTYRTYQRRRRMRHLVKTSTYNATPHVQATQFLMGISLSFFILHTPSHVFRIRIMILSLIRGSLESGRFDQIDRDLKKYFEIMYYLNFSVNFFIYFACGTQFRSVLFSKCHDVFIKLSQMKRGMCSYGESPISGITSTVGTNITEIEDEVYV